MVLPGWVSQFCCCESVMKEFVAGGLASIFLGLSVSVAKKAGPVPGVRSHGVSV
jgi:hypothetical protein